jgi:hypothetical protein
MEQYDLDKAAKVSNETWATDVEKENCKKNKHKAVYKKGGHNRCCK